MDMGKGKGKGKGKMRDERKRLTQKPPPSSKPNAVLASSTLSIFASLYVAFSQQNTFSRFFTATPLPPLLPHFLQFV